MPRCARLRRTGGEGGGLRLYRALRLLWPESWAARAKAKEAIFEDVELVFAAEPDRYIVRLNGAPLEDFRLSDTLFARLLRLAVARSSDRDVVNGGWLKKTPHLQLDSSEVDLVHLRAALVGDGPDYLAGTTAAERKALIQTSTSRPGCLRLPLNPRHIHFDPSLERMRLLGELQTEAREPAAGKKRKTSGSEEFAQQKTQTRAKVLKMLEAVRKHGVPVPEERVLKSRSTEP